MAYPCADFSHDMKEQFLQAPQEKPLKVNLSGMDRVLCEGKFTWTGNLSKKKQEHGLIFSHCTRAPPRNSITGSVQC